MHLIAERGIAGPLALQRTRPLINEETAQKFDWLQDLVNWQQQVRSPEEFLDTVKTDLFESEIYVFTPKGDVRGIPGRCDSLWILRFPYIRTSAIHCVGARVNGRMVPLKYQLQNGDTVEIVTSKTQQPSKDWLKICVTNQSQIKDSRQFVKEEAAQAQLYAWQRTSRTGIPQVQCFSDEIFEEAENFEKLKKDFGIHDDEEVLVRVGYGKLEAAHRDGKAGVLEVSPTSRIVNPPPRTKKIPILFRRVFALPLRELKNPVL